MNHQAIFRTLRPFLFLLIALGCSSKKHETRILVFSKTTVFRHESIAAGIAAIKKLGEQQHIIVDTTENADRFNEENLRRYNAVVFLSTTGDVLNQQQQNDFERFIQAGGGYVGIHAAADTEYDWPWYGKLVGAYFESHPNNPNVREAEYYTVDKNNPASDSLPDRFTRKDEFYNFKNINPNIKVLVKLDEKTYQGGTNGDNHPATWYHEYDGGRAFYTAMGHTDESYSEPLFLSQLKGGLEYVLRGNDPVELDFRKVHTKRVPEENRFTKVVLEEKLNEPVELAVLPDNRVLFIERKGAVKLFDPAVGKSVEVGKIDVSHHYIFKDGNQAEAEDGLLGLALDPKFSENHWIYLYYSPAGPDAKNILTRYEFVNDKLVPESKKVLLDVGVQREQCCHTGGSIAFDAHGNLFVSTGDNTSPRSTAYAPMDERPGRSPWDAQKGTSNTNDLRGKVLRIHPEPDGTYTIPDGNLFPKGTPKTRPEIYTMGARNPYRISVDKHTGYLYWGDVGPDAGKDSVGRGPRAYDEINQARKPGFFGWPYFVGANYPYNERNFATGKQGAPFDPAKPVNKSVNNTGLTELPPAQKAFIWYPYDVSPEFPLVGKGGRTSMAGPVFYSDDFKNAKRAFPDYYDGKLFIYEWMRGWIIAVTMNKDGDYESMEHFMPSYRFSNPMDMEFGPDGDLYLLEYGTGWFLDNEDARLVRIEYNGGNRKPVVHMAADKMKGAVPLAVNFSSAGSKDPDRDDLKYEWKITSADGKDIATANTESAAHTFDKPGIYNATLTLTDAKGESLSSKIEIAAGNDPPQLAFDITRGNQTFFFPNQSFDYEVKVTDKEDGTLESGIPHDNVALTIDYLQEGFDKIEIAQGHLSADEIAQAKGKRLMDQSDCKSCHMMDKKSIGPMYIDVAKRYKGDASAVDRLAKKIINGGNGVWGEVTMAAHPQLALPDAQEIVRYILSLGNSAQTKSLPVKGTYTVRIPKSVTDQGVLILRAAYTDKGANGLPPAAAEKVMILRSASVAASKADFTDGIQRYSLPNPPMDLIIGSSNGAYIGYKKFDLTGIDQIGFLAFAPAAYGFSGGFVEVHIDSPTGQIIGASSPITPQTAKGPAPTPVMVSAKINETTGLHDIYFVYKRENPEAAGGLFILVNEQFMYNPKAVQKLSMR